MQTRFFQTALMIALLMAGSTKLSGQEVAAEVPAIRPSEVATLIERLSDGSSEDQAAAESRLVALGPAVLESLPAITDTTSEAIRARLMRIRKQLEEQIAAKLAEPTRVSLNGTMKLSAALDAIRQQTGNRVIDNRDSYGQDANDPEISTDLDQVSFWEAIETLFDRAGMMVDPNVLEPQTLGFVSLEDGATSAKQRVRSFGRFRFEPLRTESFRNLRVEQDRILRLGLEISWEPISAPVALVYRPDTIVALDENEHSLELTGPDEPTEIPVMETGSAVEIDIPFDLPDTKSLKIARLSGTFDAMIPGQYATFEFTDLTAKKAQTKSQGGVTVSLQRVRASQDLIDVWILVQIQGADELLQSHRGWVYNNPAQLVTPDGTLHDYVGMDTFRQTETDFGISYKYDVPGDPKDFMFRYRTPAAILSVPIQFELSDIRLP